MRLVKWKRNSVIEAVKSGGLDVPECTFDFEDEGARIVHVPSGSSFVVEGNPSLYTATTVVGDNPPSSGLSYTWGTVPDRVERWAAEVRRDFDTPDLWAELQRDREILTGSRYEDVENTPFTPDEQEEIARRLREVKQFVVRTYSPSDAQVLALEARLDAAEEAASRVGRKDWLLLFGGLMLGAIADGLLLPEAVQHVVVTVLHGLDHLFGAGGGVPELPAPFEPPPPT